ncbi:MAG: hypothetical protein QF773_08810, partial [Lentisphaeria bacterium]|nr:hypothetical protein [Lentisphaeria bacterium]
RAPGAARRLCLAMGEDILVEVGPDLTDKGRAAFRSAIDKAFRPPPGRIDDSLHNSRCRAGPGLQ